MSSRFSEVFNAKWCKICSANIIEGEEHPNLDAHNQADQAQVAAAQQQEVLSKKMQATSRLIPVSSNDMLKHIAQPAAPDTLCGRPITDVYRPSTTDLVCDICADLSVSANFLVETKEILTSVKEKEEEYPITSNFNVTAVNYTRDGQKIDEDGFTVITNDNETSSSNFDSFYPFTYEKIMTTTASEFDEGDLEEPYDEIVYMGMFDEPIQFTAHWLEEDNEEEPLFLPNEEF